MQSKKVKMATVAAGCGVVERALVDELVLSQVKVAGYGRPNLRP